MASPQLTKGLIITAKGEYSLLSDWSIPEITEPTDVRIRTVAVGVNPVDWKSVDYNFCLPAFPWTIGREISGVVESVGSAVTSCKVGDCVWSSTYYRDIRSGTFQDFVVVPQHTVSAVPFNLNLEEAACLGVPALTAAMTLWKWLKFSPPSTSSLLTPPPSDPPSPSSLHSSPDQPNLLPLSDINLTSPQTPIFMLIWGGSTSTGQFLIQLALASTFQHPERSRPLEIIAVASDSTSETVKRLGAHHVISRTNRSSEDIVAEISSIAGDDLVYAIDLVGISTASLLPPLLSSTLPSHFVPIAMWNPKNDVVIHKTTETHIIEMKQFVLDPSSQLYAKELVRCVENGSVKIPELDVWDGGVDVLQEALMTLKKGDLRGRKLVVRW